MSNDNDRMISPRTDLVSNAEVKVLASTDNRNHAVAEIDVNGKYTHRFSPESRVSKALTDMTVQQLEERLNGGHFFFINGVLHDFRDGNYRGFVHSNSNIDALKEVIGIRLGGNGSRRAENVQGRASMSRVWSEQEIAVPGIGDGGVFNSRLTFNWNPFVETIRSAFDIERLICANGMMGMTSLFNARIPLLNRWEEHLDIANMQIQNKLHSMMCDRIQQMTHERATLADCLRLQDHARERIDSHENASGGFLERLRKIVKAVAPDIHLRDHYKPTVFKDRRLAAQLPSHLTMFDAYNIATEIASHTKQASGSSNHALDKMSNELMFDRTDRSQHAARFGAPMQASFSDPDQAFFGADEDSNDE